MTPLPSQSPIEIRAALQRLDLPAFAVDALRRHRARQAEERLRRGRDWQDHDLVCCDPIGRPLSPRRVLKAFRALCREHELAVSFHRLRHGFASMLLASEVHPKVVQTALGYSSIQVTIDTYSTCCRAWATRPRATLTARSEPM